MDGSFSANQQTKEPSLCLFYALYIPLPMFCIFCFPHQNVSANPSLLDEGPECCLQFFPVGREASETSIDPFPVLCELYRQLPSFPVRKTAAHKKATPFVQIQFCVQQIQQVIPFCFRHQALISRLPLTDWFCIRAGRTDLQPDMTVFLIHKNLRKAVIAEMDARDNAAIVFQAAFGAENLPYNPGVRR